MPTEPNDADGQSDAASTATIAVLFCDVVASTERLSRIGDDAGDRLRRELFGVLRRCVTETHGIVVKSLGDGMMAVFERSTIDAVECARRMHAGAAGVDPDDPVELRVGVSVGEASTEDGDWFGTPIVEAARLCSVADANQTLAVATVRTLVGSRAGGHRFRDLGPMVLKGLPAPVIVVDVDGSAVAEDAHPGRAPALPVAEGAPASVADAIGSRRFRYLAVAIGAAVAGLLVTGAVVMMGSDGNSASTRGGKQGTTVSTTIVGSKAPEGYRPKFEPKQCDPSTASLVPGATCGDLVVPEVRSNPNGPTVRVAVIKAPASGKATAPPVLVTDLNEPLDTDALRDVADLYSVGLRGVKWAGGRPLECPGLSLAWAASYSARADDPTAIAQRVAAAGDCQKKLLADGVQLAGYNLVEVSDDMRDAVDVLGLRKVVVSAGGFDAPAAIRFVNRNSDRVAALLLTNPVPPGDSVLADPASTLSKQFANVNALCAANSACNAKFGNLDAAYRALFGSLSAAPKPVSAVPLNGSTAINVLVDGRRLALAMATAFEKSDAIGLVPASLSVVSPQILASAALNDLNRDYLAGDARPGVILSYLCSYDVPLHRLADISNATLPQFAGADDPTLPPVCETWGGRHAVGELSVQLNTEAPVLIADGGISRSGANGWGARLANRARHAVVVHFPTMGDDLVFVQPPCLGELRKRFVTDPGAKLAIKSCEAESPPIEFVGTAG